MQHFLGFSQIKFTPGELAKKALMIKDLVKYTQFKPECLCCRVLALRKDAGVDDDNKELNRFECPSWTSCKC